MSEAGVNEEVMRRKIIVELLGIPLFIIPIPFHYHYSPAYWHAVFNWNPL